MLWCLLDFTNLMVHMLSHHLKFLNSMKPYTPLNTTKQHLNRKIDHLY
jgi:hypothetical protein